MHNAVRCYSLNIIICSLYCYIKLLYKQYIDCFAYMIKAVDLCLIKVVILYIVEFNSYC